MSIELCCVCGEEFPLDDVACQPCQEGEGAAIDAFAETRLQTLRARIEVLERQRGGLARVIRSGGPIPHGTYDKIPTYMMAKASSILQEIAVEASDE